MSNIAESPALSVLDKLHEAKTWVLKAQIGSEAIVRERFTQAYRILDSLNFGEIELVDSLNAGNSSVSDVILALKESLEFFFAAKSSDDRISAKKNVIAIASQLKAA